MPIYEVTQDATGVTLELEGDRPPTQQDVERAFAFAGRQKYPSADVIQAPPSLLEQAKAVAPSFLRVASPIANPPSLQDIATVGRTIQKIAGREPQPGMLEGASRIEKEGVMALLSASPEKRELAAKAADIARIVSPGVRDLPESITRPAVQVVGQTAADLLSPMNLMTLGVAGAARQAARIPSLAATAGEFAEGVAPSAARAAQIADLRRAAETARATTQAGEAIPFALAPEMTRGAAESAGIAMQTIADPNATAEDKLRASFEATLGTLFAAGLGAQAARTLGMRGRKGVTQADVLENLASQKQTVGEAINKVSGLIDQMDRIVPVENFRTQFRELIAGMNPDEPFIYRPEPIGEGPRVAPEGGRLPVGEVVEPQAPETLKTQEQILTEKLRARDERMAAEQQTALEREAVQSGTPLRTAEEVQAQRAAERQALRERSAAIREALGRREFTAEELMRGEVAPEAPVTEPVSRPLIVPELEVQRAAPREGGMLPPREAEVPVAPEGTPLRSVEDILAERLRAREQRIAAEQEAAATRPSTPLETVEQKLTRALAERDRRLAAEAVAESLESGAAQGEPVRVTRKKVEEAIGVGRKEAGLPVAEQTIFNEVWNKAVEETQGKFRQKAEGVAQQLEGLRTQVEPGLGANPFPQLMGAAWNGALSVAQAVIRAGGSIADGVAAGLRYARDNFKDKFDEAEFSKQLTGTISRPSPIQVPPKMEARAFSERMAAAPGIPPVIREAIAQSPESSYVRQNLKQVAEQAKVKTDQQLALDILNPESNTRTVDTLELANRKLNEGKMDEFLQLGIPLSKNLTTAGQIINQAKLLNSTTPAGFVLLVSKTMEKFGKKITPEQAGKLAETMARYRDASNQINRAELNWKQAAENNDIAGIQKGKADALVADANRMEADVDLLKQLSRINPASAGDLYLATVQGSVLSPKSIEGGALGNLMGYPFREASDIIAAGLDSIFGGNNSYYDKRARILTRLKEFYGSLPEVKRILLQGSDAAPYEVGTVSGSPLNAQRAFGRLIEDWRNNAIISRSTPRNFYEAFFGAIPDLFLRATQAVDAPFRRAERAVAIEELGRARGLSESQLELAKRKPELFLITEEAQQKGARGFTEKDLGEIEYESLARVFQQDNAVTKAVSAINQGIKERFGNKVYVPYRVITSLFQKTPINVAAEVLTYTPLGLLQYADWGALSAKQKQKIISKVIVGSTVMTSFNYLYDKGVITPNLDTPGETNKARELAKAGGVMPPGSLNVSGLRRLVSGRDPSFQPGDTVKDLSRMGTLGALGLITGTAKRLEETARTDVPEYLSVLKGSVMSGINFMQQQQFMKGAADTIKLMSEESGSSLDRVLRNLGVTAVTPFAPNILAASRRAQREYQPAIGHEGFAKDAVNELNQRFAAIGLQIPGTKDPNAMPVRRDLWGEPVKQTPKSENPWVYNLFSMWNSREIEADPLNASIYNLWRRTADNQAIPSVPNPKITYENKTFERLTPDQYDRYTQLVGFYRRQAAEYAFTRGAYQQGSDEQRLEILKKAYERGFKIGKYRFLKELRESGQSLTPQAGRRGYQGE